MIARAGVLAQGPRSVRVALGLAALLVVALAVAAAVLVHPVAGLAVVLGLAATPFVLQSARLALLAVVAVVCLLPFGAFPLGLGFNPTFLDLALLALYLIVAVRLALRDQAWRWPRLSFGVLAFIGLMVLALLVGSAHGSPDRNDLRQFGELVLAAGLYFIVANLIADEADVRWLFRALVACGAVAAGVGLALYVLPGAWQSAILSALRVVGYPSGAVLRYLNDDPSRLQRATGTSIDPNSFGGMLAVIGALLGPQLVARNPVVPRRQAVIAMALLVGALCATVSRGSLMGLVVALAVVGLARDRRWLLGLIAAAVALLLVARITPWTSDYVAHLVAGLRVQDRATQMRAGEYRDALRLVERYPLLGVGFGAPGDVDLYRGVSMLYLIIAETMGLVGLAAFLALVGAVGLVLARAWRKMRPGRLRPVVLGCLAALSAALASGLVDHYFFTYPHAFALLWLVVGLGMAAAALPDVEGAEPAPGSTPSSKEEEKKSDKATALQPPSCPSAEFDGVDGTYLTSATGNFP